LCIEYYINLFDRFIGTKELWKIYRNEMKDIKIRNETMKITNKIIEAFKKNEEFINLSKINIDNRFHF
jgi:hypothetical protein